MFVVTKKVSKIVLNDILSSSLPPSFLPSSTEFHSVVRGMTLRPLTSILFPVISTVFFFCHLDRAE